MLIRNFGYWVPFINALGGIQFHIGSQKITMLGLFKALTTLFVLLSAANLVCGIALLMRKPVSQEDFILLNHPSGKGVYGGRIVEMGLLYVRMQTRDGTTELLPNEKFMSQKIVKLSYSDRRVRLHLGLGISYDSDVKNAIFVAKEAALTVEIVFCRTPSPCAM
jgi:small-conductance mechanosensitive channel